MYLRNLWHVEKNIIAWDLKTEEEAQEVYPELKNGVIQPATSKWARKVLFIPYPIGTNYFS